jgi:hypothetical protein
MGNAVVSRNAKGLRAAEWRSVLACREQGMSEAMCAKAAGVSPRALREALAQGDADIEAGVKSPEAQCAAEYDKAEAKFLARNLAVIHNAAGKGNWQAAAWLLERTHPEQFAESKRLEVGASSEAPTVVIDTPDEVEVPRVGTEDKP